MLMKILPFPSHLNNAFYLSIFHSPTSILCRDSGYSVSRNYVLDFKEETLKFSIFPEFGKVNIIYFHKLMLEL